jgi:hypothetical protein
MAFPIKVESQKRYSHFTCNVDTNIYGKEFGWKHSLVLEICNSERVKHILNWYLINGSKLFYFCSVLCIAYDDLMSSNLGS